MSLLRKNSKKFGLTRDEYEILLDDIAQAIEEANKEYGCYPTLKIDKVPKPKYVDHTTIHYLNKTRPSIEEVAIARGIIRIIPTNSKEAKK